MRSILAKEDALIDVDAALKEIKEKSHADIEKETAYKWAARSIASFQLCLEEDSIERYAEGEDYRREAQEHASQVEDGGDVLRKVEKQIEKARQKAKKSIE